MEAKELQAIRWSTGFSSRFARIVEAVGGRAAAAQHLGYSQEQLRRWESGKAVPPLYPIATLCQESGTTLEWLLAGSADTSVSRAELDRAIALLASMRTEDDLAEAVQTAKMHEVRAHPLLSETLDWFGRTRGNMSTEDGSTEEMGVFGVFHSLPTDGLPAYIHCGKGSVVASYYGQGFAARPRQAAKVVDKDLEQRASKVYRDAVEGGRPVLQKVSTVVRTRGVGRRLQYIRVVCPARIKGQNGVLVMARETAPPVLLDD